MAIKTSTIILLGLVASSILLIHVSARPESIVKIDNGARVFPVYGPSSSNATAGAVEKDNCTDSKQCPERCCFDHSSQAGSYYCCGRNAGCCPQETSNGCCT